MGKYIHRQYGERCSVNFSDHSALPPGRLFCFGLGYTGARLARALRASGWEVSGTSRDAGVMRELAADGILGTVDTRYPKFFPKIQEVRFWVTK